MDDAPKTLFRRVEFDKLTKRARTMFCREAKGSHGETEYTRSDKIKALTAQARAEGYSAGLNSAARRASEILDVSE